MNYDFKIRKEHLDLFYDLAENISDYDMLRLGTEIIRIGASRLDGDLNNKEIYEEYIKLKYIIEQLENIIKNYV